MGGCSKCSAITASRELTPNQPLAGRGSRGGQWSAAEIRVGIMGLGELGADSARALRALGFPGLGLEPQPEGRSRA